MKLKGLSTWERYIEYAVLGVAVLIFGWFAWSTFGTAISIKSGAREVTTATVDDELSEVASRLKPRLRDDAPSPMDFGSPRPLLSVFNAARAASIAPADRVGFPGLDLTADLAVNQDLIAELRTYIEPEIPAPTDVLGHQWFGTVATEPIDEIEGLSGKYSGPPHDATWVQVAAKFDFDEVLRRFGEAQATAAAIPAQWFDERVDVLDMRVERQQLRNGIWSESMVVEAMPGRLTYRGEIAIGDVDTTRRDEMLRELRIQGRQPEIIAPDFYDLKGFSPDGILDPDAWVEIPEGPEIIDDGPGADLRRRIRNLARQQRQIEQRLEGLRRSLARAEAEAARDAGGGGGGSLGAGGGAGSGGASAADQEKINRIRDTIRQTETEQADLARQREDLLEQLMQVDAAAAADEAASFGGERWIWAHDLDVEPGDVYRYRMTLDVANPFFGRKPSLYPEQQPLANNVQLASLTSDWSGPIEVQRPSQWFLLRAMAPGTSTTNDVLDAGRVVAEVYRFTDGAWHQDQFQVATGQRLAAPNDDTFATDWFVLDMLPWLDAGEADRRADRGDWVLLQNLRDGRVQVVRPWEQAIDPRLRDLRDQARQSQPIDEEFGEPGGGPPVADGGGDRGGGRGGGRDDGGGRGGGGRGGGG